ncbi:MAG: hypothetical protein HZB67_06085 [Candidatus Aenigmarchaeota archaeon]|nr:hypothetical protein [Candidatus Aenigmarchaeota archaeon]
MVEYPIEMGLMILVVIVALAVVISSSIYAEQEKHWALENMTKYAVQSVQMTKEPDASVSWSPQSNKFSYKISMKGIGIKNTIRNEKNEKIQLMPVILFKGVTAMDTAKSVIWLEPDEQNYMDFIFELESSDAPLIKAADLKVAGVITDDKIYSIEDSDANARLGSFYSRTEAHALYYGQNLLINNFMISSKPYALAAKTIPLSRCDVPITVRCKDDAKVIWLKDFYRKKWWSAWALPNAASLGPECSSDADNVCEEAVSICGGSVKVSLIRSGLNCDSIKNIRIETTSVDEKYDAGESALISFWKYDSKCWENPLSIQPGCEEEFYGAFDVPIPAEQYMRG